MLRSDENSVNSRNKIVEVDVGITTGPWEIENRSMATDAPNIHHNGYNISPTDESLRADRNEIVNILKQDNINLVDVRLPDEDSRTIIAAMRMTETAQTAKVEV